MLERLQQGFSPVHIGEHSWDVWRSGADLSHETIYTALYATPRGKLRANVLDLLRRHHKARKVEAKNRRSRSIPDMSLILMTGCLEVSERWVPVIGKGKKDPSLARETYLKWAPWWNEPLCSLL